MYKISFIPKKSDSQINIASIQRKVTLMAGSMKSLISAYQEDSKTESRAVDELIKQAVGAILHTASLVIESGNIRTICAPDDKLKAQQRRILRSLQNIPMHRSSHGFVIGRDSVTCASAHTSYWGNKAHSLVILNMDAKNFFPSITSQVVRKALEANGVDDGSIKDVIHTCMCRADDHMAISIIDGIAQLIKSNSTTALMDDIRKIFIPNSGVTIPYAVSKKLAFAFCKGFLSLGPSVNMVNKFLPQGSPTSPFLSNISMKIVDIRLSAMATTFGGFYTRYADDLTVSWKVPTKGVVMDSMYRCSELVLAEYGVAMNRRKKRIMGTGTRQDIVGLCVNSGNPTITRKRRSKVRAAVHNELVRGSQRLRDDKRSKRDFEDYSSSHPTFKRQSFLMGTIGYVSSVHKAEAAKYFGVMRHVNNQSGIRNLLGTLHSEELDGIDHNHTTRSRTSLFEGT